MNRIANYQNYITETYCGWDGGDCLHPDYPNCHVDKPHWIGDGAGCNAGEGYTTIECGWDGGDCVP